MNKKEQLKTWNSYENYMIVNRKFLDDYNLSWKAKGLFTYILSSNNSVIHFDELNNCGTNGKESVSYALTELIDNEYIRELTDLDKFNYLNNKNLENIGEGFNKCSWCKINTIVIHGHHYPISKYRGGTNIVNICPNCHNEFHARLFTINL